MIPLYYPSVEGSAAAFLPNGLRVTALDREWIEGLRELRNRPEIQRWFVDSTTITAEQQIAWFGRFQADAGDHMWVVLDGDTVVAAAGLRCTGETEAEFGRLMVDRRVPRARGTGRLLLSWILDSAVDMGITAVSLEVKDDNRHAIRLYESLGFVRSGSAKDGLVRMLHQRN